MENLSRRKLLQKAIHDCYREMYAKSQPYADYDAICQELKDGKINEDLDGKVYERHYLSLEEHKYIVNKYMDAYKIQSEWPDYVEVVENYLKDGGYKTVYEDKEYDEDGNIVNYPDKHIEKDKSLKELFKEYFEKSLGTSDNSMSDDLCKIVMEKIDKCKNYYKFNGEENSFIFEMTLGHAPTSNKETVKNWWKEHYNHDIEIEERNPDLLWSMDEYGDEFEEIMEDEYGENWKQITWDMYNESRKKNDK